MMKKSCNVLDMNHMWNKIDLMIVIQGIINKNYEIYLYTHATEREITATR